MNLWLISGKKIASTKGKANCNMQNQYEVERNENVAKNKAFLASLNLRPLNANGQHGATTSKPPKKSAKVMYF